MSPHDERSYRRLIAPACYCGFIHPPDVGFDMLSFWRYLRFWATLALIGLSLLPSGLNAQDIPLREARYLYFEAWQEKDCGANALYDKLEDLDLDSSPVMMAYRGAAQTTRAMCVFFPWDKWKTFTEGRDELEEAIRLAPDEPEIRFLRISVQAHIPSILDYNDLNEDVPLAYDYLVKSYSDRTADHFTDKMTELLLFSDLLDEQQAAYLRSLVESNKITHEGGVGHSGR